MKTEVEKLNPTRVRIDVEVPFGELQEDFSKAYKTLAHQVRIPGFRPGKAPAKLLEAKLGRAAILEQVIQDVIPHKYSEAVEQAEIKVIGQPTLDIKEIKDGETISFYAEVDVCPEISLPEFSGLSVTVNDVLTVDEVAGQELENLRARFGSVEEVERAVEDGDIVTINLSTTVDGQDIPEAAAQGLTHRVGDETLLEGLNEAIIGLEKGQSQTFTTNLVAGEHKDKPAEVTVFLDGVKTTHLPELDDEFAQLASKFDSLEELKTDLLEQAKVIRDNSIAAKSLEKTLEALVENIHVDLPETVVEQQLQQEIQRILQQVGGNEEVFTQYLAMQGTDLDSYKSTLRTQVERAVKIELLLDEIAEKYDIQPNQDDFGREVVRQARNYGIAPEEFLQQVIQHQAFNSLLSAARRTKTLEHVAGLVQLQYDNGEAIDINEFLQREATQDDEQTTTESIDEE